MIINKIIGRLRFNPLIWTMIAAGFLIMSATGIVSPILAVFVTDQIRGGSLAVVGFSTAVFWIVKSLVQIPVGFIVDDRHDDRFTFTLMIAGLIVSALVPLLYFVWAREAWHVYVLQGLDGFGFALSIPTWYALFTNHLDRGCEATEWATYSNATGIGYAIAAAWGGLAAERYGFSAVFPVISIVMFLGIIVLVRSRKMFHAEPVPESIQP